MLTIAFFDHGALVKDEVIAALRRIPEVRLMVVKVPITSDGPQVQTIATSLVKFGCGLVITLNNWGLDASGELHENLLRSGIAHVNWFVDDPWYMEMIHGMRFSPAPNRIDFTTDRAQVDTLRRRGYRAFFLPLGTDPLIFRPGAQGDELRQDLCFVGHSSAALYREMSAWCDRHAPGLTQSVDALPLTLNLDLMEPDIRTLLSRCSVPDALRDPAIYRLTHLLGVRLRARILGSLADRYPDFTLCGDEGWHPIFPSGKVSSSVGYYTNLCETYRTTRINLDINRSFIKDGLTQRVFDCLASRGFILTSYKPVLDDLLETQGPGAEIVSFDSIESLHDRIDFFLANEQERCAMADRGYRAVLARHTYDHRVSEMLRLVGQNLL